MFMHGARNVRLVDDAQKVFERDRQQARFGLGEKRGDCVEIIAIDSMMAKHAPESKRGKQAQSIEPSRPTSAAVWRSPRSA